MAEPTYTAAARSHPSRWLLLVAFAVAFPLCLAHGVASNHTAPVPAVGLVPLAFSAIAAVLLLRLPPEDADEGGADEEAGIAPTAEESTADTAAAVVKTLAHPIAVFLSDVVFATAIMIVLVFTWLSPDDRPALSMLAAYATVPLLLAFFTHLYLALYAFYDGLALHSLSQWVAWRAVPADCPNCDYRLRPSLPELPWVKGVKESWRRARARRAEDYAPVLQDDAEPYRDEVDGAGAAQAGEVQPEAVEVRSKKKGKSTPAAEEATAWGS